MYKTIMPFTILYAWYKMNMHIKMHQSTELYRLAKLLVIPSGLYKYFSVKY